MSNKLFQLVDIQLPGRSAFGLTRNRKSTYKIGYLYPNLCIPVSPGDAVKGTTENFLRFQPMLFPMLHEVDVYQRYFFVPYRLVCEGFPEWWAQENGNQPGDEQESVRLSKLPAYLTVDDVTRRWMTVGSLLDHLGVPPMVTYNNETGQWQPYIGSIGANNRFSALWLKAYNLIWNEYYRDQNLEQPIDIFPDQLGRIPYDVWSDTEYNSWFQLKRANWEKDYFTSSLPDTQKGTPVTIGNLIPSGDLPVEFRTRTATPSWKNPVTGATAATGFLGVGSTGGSTRGKSVSAAQGLEDTYTAQVNVAYDPNGTLAAVLNTSQNPYTVEALRKSMMLQRYYELLMRGGSRYVEQIRNIFGVTPDDLRIGRPKYLGGGVQNVMISEVVQQSQSSQDSTLGELAGKGLSYGKPGSFSTFITEHGVIMGIFCILPRSGYGQGMPKELLKEDPFEFLNPRFDHLGEQPVWKGELYYDYSKSRDENLAAFGYMPNYMEYRTAVDELAGQMRTSLSSWHMNRLFDSQPVLNADFVKVKETDVDRVFAVDTEVSDPVIAESVHHIKAIRPLSKYGTPGF